MKKIIPYSTQTISKTDIESVVKVLKSDFLTQGPKVKEFEKTLSKKVKAKYAVAFNSATSALHASCLALSLKKNEALWTVPNTFVASANCSLLAGGKVDFIDIDPKTYNININFLEEKLKFFKNKKKLPKIVVPVHFGGNPVDQDKIWKLSQKYNFKILEDASHSLGASYKGEPVGSCRWSDITVFSFHPVKIITTIEGGIATTNNYELYKKLKMIGSHGITKSKLNFKKKTNDPWYYEQQLLGLNYRMSDISAALGLSQLKKLDHFIQKRNEIASIYEKNLITPFLEKPKIAKYSRSSFHLYVVKLKKEQKKFHKKLFNFLRKKNILVNLHYIPVHLHPFYKSLGFRSGDFKYSEEHAKSVISLPIYPGLKKKKIMHIINLIHKFFKRIKR